MVGKGSQLVIIGAPVGESPIATICFAAAADTGPSATSPEGLHNSVDSGNQVVLLEGPKWVPAGAPAIP